MINEYILFWVESLDIEGKVDLLQKDRVRDLVNVLADDRQSGT